MKMFGLIESSGRVVKTEVSVNLDSEEFFEALSILFDKAYSKKFGHMFNYQFGCGVPGNKAVVWRATNSNCIEKYLHISFEDQRCAYTREQPNAEFNE